MSKALSYINPLRGLARWRRKAGQVNRTRSHAGHCCGFPGEPECCMTERRVEAKLCPSSHRI